MNRKSEARDMTPGEIRMALFDAYGGHGAQAAIARELDVDPSAVSRVIDGATSDRVRRAIARHAGLDIRRVWPSVYLYGTGTKRPGRPRAESVSAAC